MNCETAQTLIQARLDRDLDVERAIALGGHLALCAECRELSADLEQLCTATTALPEFATRGALTARALSRVRPIKLEPRTSPWRVAFYFGTAVCIALLIGQAINLSGLLRPEIDVANERKSAPQDPPASNFPERPAQHTNVVARMADSDAQSGQDALKALVAQHYLSEQRRPEADRQRERRHAELLGDLHRPGKASPAVVALLGGEVGPANAANAADVWPVAASLADPQTGGEVFAAAAKMKVELRFVPIYIAALDTVKTREKAAELLGIVSGKHLGPHKEAWLAWWSQARTQLRDD